MIKTALCIAALLVPAQLAADELTSSSRPMTAAEFEAYTTGKTLTYAHKGATPYGAEAYLPGRRVEWAFDGGECKTGQWFEDLGLICFVYEDNPTAQCWSFFQTPQGLTAQFENEENASPLYEIEQSDEPLFCPGPQVGV